jgi:type IV secretory pathway TrbF-like protein
MATTFDPYGRPRDHFARVVGLGRRTLWLMGTATVISSLSAAGAGLVAWYQVQGSHDRVERWVVYLDDQSLPVAQARVGSTWQPEDGTFVDFASRWVRYLRARPLDLGALKYQRAQVIKATDRQVYTALSETMKAADEQVRSSAIDVHQISANLVEHRPDQTAVVLVRWTEQVRAAGHREQTWTATLVVAHQPPRARREFERNPLGLFVTNFQITQESS